MNMRQITIDQIPSLVECNGINFIGTAVTPWHAHGIDCAIKYIRSQGRTVKGLVFIKPALKEGKIYYILDEQNFVNDCCEFYQLAAIFNTQPLYLLNKQFNRFQATARYNNQDYVDKHLVFIASPWHLVRGKTGRVYGDLNTLLVMMKGIPLAYNKDMQEDKEAIFDAVDTLELCLKTVTPMLDTMKTLPANMRRAAAKGFINATDCADYLTKKGMPFRDAYKLTGCMVSDCISKDKTLEELTLDEFRGYSALFENDIYDAIDLIKCCEGRTSYGGPSEASVKKQIELASAQLGAWEAANA